MDGGFGENVSVQSVTQVDGVDVIALQIRVPTSMFVSCFAPSRAPSQGAGVS